MPAEDIELPPAVMPRLRARTNDPAREYAARAGEVEALPDSVASLILCHKGWAKIERHEIAVTMEGEKLLFASRESVTIAQHNGTGRRVLWVLNRREPNVLHILTDTGGYVESIPRKGQAQWFSQDAASQAARSDAQSMLQRDMSRVRELHREDSASAAKDTEHNVAQTRRLVLSFPAATARETAPAEAPRADAIVAAMRSTEERAEARDHSPAGALARMAAACGSEDED